MRTKSIKNGILRLLFGLVLASCLAILINVWIVTYQQAHTKVNKDLHLAQVVLRQVLNSQDNLLATSASSLKQDSTFKQAIAKANRKQIAQSLQKHGNEIDANLLGLFTLDGKKLSLEISSYSRNKGYYTSVKSSESLELSQTTINNTIEQGSFTTFYVVNNQIYKIIALRIDTQKPIAIVLLGIALNDTFVQRLESTTETDVSLIQKDSEQTANNTVQSQLFKSVKNQLIKVEDLAWYHLIIFSSAYVSNDFFLHKTPTNEYKVRFLQPVKALTTNFSAFNYSIVGTIILFLIMSAYMVNVYVRKITKPLDELVVGLQKVAAGDFEQSIRQNSDLVEVSALSTAFTNMQKNISQRESKVNFQSQHDTLTNLLTRNHVGSLIDKRLASSNNSHSQFIAFVINIVGFRDINDIFGYQYGDQCLIQLAYRIEKLGGVSARLAGGEFLWLPRNGANYTSQHAKTEIKEFLQQPMNFEGVVVRFELAIGTIACPTHASSAEHLFRLSNIVIDEALLDTTGIVDYQDQFEQKYIRRVQIISRLKQALENNSDHLALHYQPKLHLESQTVRSAEALIRWSDPVLGFVPPDEFISIAEGAGLISELTNWVINRAILDACALRRKDVNLSIAVNLSAKDIANPELLEDIKKRLARASLPVSALSFEITESDLVEDAQKAREYLQAFKDSGYELAIDDFGTGYSSLAYLKTFPVNTLKIDKSFVLNLSESQDDRDIVETIVQLAQKFKLKTVAEGVEDRNSLAILHHLGCTWIQGYYICKPLPLVALYSWLSDKKSHKWTNTIKRGW